jgi:hypothetical protein
MSAHPAPRATRSIRAETAGSSGLALGPNQRGKAGGEVEASIPVMAMAHQRTRRRVRPANPSSSTRVDRATHVPVGDTADRTHDCVASCAFLTERLDGRPDTRRAPPSGPMLLLWQRQRRGGGSGIRTHGAHHPTVFKTVPFGRSGIPPSTILTGGGRARPTSARPGRSRRSDAARRVRRRRRRGPGSARRGTRACG